jgi:hypothetical protein
MLSYDTTRSKEGIRASEEKLGSIFVDEIGVHDRRNTTVPPIALTAPQRSRKETAVSDDDVESYEPPSHQFEAPVVLVQDSTANLKSANLEAIPETIR